MSLLKWLFSLFKRKPKKQPINDEYNVKGEIFDDIIVQYDNITYSYTIIPRDIKKKVRIQKQDKEKGFLTIDTCYKTPGRQKTNA